MRVRQTLAIAISIVWLAPSLEGQRPPRPAWKGIWEPVSYPADIHLTDVFFVNPDVGWATSGTSFEGGMLLHTSDAGANWTVQLGDHDARAGRQLLFHDRRRIDAAAPGRPRIRWG